MATPSSVTVSGERPGAFGRGAQPRAHRRDRCAGTLHAGSAPARAAIEQRERLLEREPDHVALAALHLRYERRPCPGARSRRPVRAAPTRDVARELVARRGAQRDVRGDAAFPDAPAQCLGVSRPRVITRWVRPASCASISIACAGSRGFPKQDRVQDHPVSAPSTTRRVRRADAATRPLWRATRRASVSAGASRRARRLVEVGRARLERDSGAAQQRVPARRHASQHDRNERAVARNGSGARGGQRAVGHAADYGLRRSRCHPSAGSGSLGTRWAVHGARVAHERPGPVCSSRCPRSGAAPPVRSSRSMGDSETRGTATASAFPLPPIPPGSPSRSRGACSRSADRARSG